jgi:GntR family transcriptional regulator / MocR family aminotransferase
MPSPSSAATSGCAPSTSRRTTSTGVVVDLGTLSKILAPGLRLRFVVAPAPLLEKLAAIRTFIDRQGDHTVERAVAELLEDGEVQCHARRARRA